MTRGRAGWSGWGEGDLGFPAQAAAPATPPRIGSGESMDGYPETQACVLASVINQNREERQ